MSNAINLDRLKESLPKGLVSRISNDYDISKARIYNALNGRTTGIESVEIIDIVIKERDHFLELVEKLKTQTNVELKK